MVSEYLPCVFSSTKSPALLIAVSTLSAFCESRSLALSRNPMHCSFPMGLPNVPREPFAGKTLLAAAGGRAAALGARRGPSAAVSGRLGGRQVRKEPRHCRKELCAARRR